MSWGSSYESEVLLIPLDVRSWSSKHDQVQSNELRGGWSLTNDLFQLYYAVHLVLIDVRPSDWYSLSHVPS